MSLDAAIARCAAEFDSLGLGSPRGPKEGTTGWYVARARAAGLSMLRRAKQLEATSPDEFEGFARAHVGEVKMSTPEEV